jgi:DNA-binding MarR family transcriptional regulator
MILGRKIFMEPEVLKNKRYEATRLFLYLSHKGRGNIGKNFEKLNITFAQGMVLKLLFDNKELKVSEIAKKLGLSNSTVSGIIDRLEKQKRVRRIRSTKDKRVVYVKIAGDFILEHEKVKRLSESRIEKMLEKNTEEEIDKIIEGLMLLKKVFEKSY